MGTVLEGRGANVRAAFPRMVPRVAYLRPLREGGSEQVHVGAVDAFETTGSCTLILLLLLLLQVVMLTLKPIGSLICLPVGLLLLLSLAAARRHPVIMSIVFLQCPILGTAPTPTPAIRVAQLEGPAVLVPQVSDGRHKGGPGDFQLTPSGTPFVLGGSGGKRGRRRGAVEVGVVRVVVVVVVMVRVVRVSGV